MKKTLLTSTLITATYLFSAIIDQDAFADSIKIYWTDNISQKIERANLDGSARETLISPTGGVPEAIAIDGTSGKMYWANETTNKIERANLDGSARETVVSGLDSACGVALDTMHGKIYWSDIGTGKIQRANLDGSGIEDIVNTTGRPDRVITDVSGGKIYWSDYINNTIEAANLDGSSRQTIISTGLVTPLGLALDAEHGRLYWADGSNTYQRIECANLDGSGRTTILSNLLWLKDIAIDNANGKLYWSQTTVNPRIACANLDGSNIQNIITTGLSVPRGLAIGPVPEPATPIVCIADINQPIEAQDPFGAKVTLDGSCSSDIDSTPETNDDINDFNWYRLDPADSNNEIFLGKGEIIDCNLPLGENTIILEVIDKAGATDSNEITITIEDTTPPEFNLSVSPKTLWPANHKMIKITPTCTATDLCDPSPKVSRVGITANEPCSPNDIKIDPDGSIQLCATRSGNSKARIYTITYQTCDSSANCTTKTATVMVPHDMRK